LPHPTLGRKARVASRLGRHPSSGYQTSSESAVASMRSSRMRGPTGVHNLRRVATAVFATVVPLAALAAFGGVSYASSEASRLVGMATGKASLDPTAAQDQYRPGKGLNLVVSARLLHEGKSGGSGNVVLRLSPTKRTVCWRFTQLVDVGDPRTAHVH